METFTRARNDTQDRGLVFNKKKIALRLEILSSLYLVIKPVSLSSLIFILITLINDLHFLDSLHNDRLSTACFLFSFYFKLRNYIILQVAKIDADKGKKK